MKKLFIFFVTIVMFYGCKSTTSSTSSVIDDNIDASYQYFTSNEDSDVYEVEQLIMKEINDLRKSSLRSSLKNNNALSCAARKHSEDQAKKGTLGNWGFPLSRLSQVRSCGSDQNEIIALTVENSAMYPPSSTTRVASYFMNMWKNNFKSKLGMLDNNSSFIGVGVVKFGHAYYATYIFGR